MDVKCACSHGTKEWEVKTKTKDMIVRNGDVGNGAPQACDIPMAIGPLKTRVPSLCVK